MGTIMPALLESLTQDNRVIRLSTPLGADKLVAECLRGEEALSAPYKMTVTALSDARGRPVLLLRA